MKKFLGIFLFLAFAILFLSVNYANAEDTKKQTTKVQKNYSEREYTVETKDGHRIVGYLSYPKTKMKGYPTIIMLHSIGRSSYDWKPLQEKFNNLGFAVLRVDFRGHGKSVYDKTFRQRHWTRYKVGVFSKYPQDIIEIIDKIQKETKKADFNNYSIIGSDIGANTAVLMAKELKQKPKALILISPSMTFKGLYIPVALTQIDKTPILAITCKTNAHFMQEQENLSKFAQGTFKTYNTDTGNADMLIIKQHQEVQEKIIKWTTKYYNK